MSSGDAVNWGYACRPSRSRRSMRQWGRWCRRQLPHDAHVEGMGWSRVPRADLCDHTLHLPGLSSAGLTPVLSSGTDMPWTAHILVIDQGTTSTRAIVVRRGGRAGGHGAAGIHPAFTQDPAGWSTIRRKSGQPSSPPRGRPCPTPGLPPPTSPPSASPTSARPW